MYDFHVHTHFSNDCTIDMESYIEPAIAKGLKGICFTDHVDIDYPSDTTNFEICYTDYKNEIDRLREKYAEKIQIFTGVEFGLQPQIIDQDKIYFEGKFFDYVIGSIHAAHKRELYGGDFLKNKTDHEGILDYFEDLIYCVQNFKSYSNLGHIDAISRYVGKGSFSAVKYMEYFEEALRYVVHNGKGIELNTSGKRYGLPEFHPGPEILKLFRQLGGEIVTLGSDSHSTPTLGWGFYEAVELLKTCGFKYHAIYKQGKPEFIKL